MFGFGRFVKSKRRTNSKSPHQDNNQYNTNQLKPYGDSLWYDYNNLWEPSVLLALRDLIKPGHTVFDVGANMGGLSQAISRLTGPKGLVVAFEASPRIIGITHQNLIINGCHNAVLLHRAVYSQSNCLLEIFEGHHLNDSIYKNWEASNNPKAHNIISLALDDYIFSSKIFPNTIKMDIEGAEYDALIGAQRTIKELRPNLILEQTANDARCFNLLRHQDYLAIDSNTYQSIETEAEYLTLNQLINIIYIHKDKLHESPYKPPIIKKKVLDLVESDFHPNHMGGYSLKKTFHLPAGRYFFDMHFSALGLDNNLFAGVRLGGKDIFRYNAPSAFLARTYTNWPVGLPRGGEVMIYFDFHDNTKDATFNPGSVSIFKVDIAQPEYSYLVLD